jgi:2-polyprenyl-3-methyl-5-hydroxy-6-metoxy-1,4-benzoquinol methylase
MPKKIICESAIHQLACAWVRMKTRHEVINFEKVTLISKWISDLRFESLGPRKVRVTWCEPTEGEELIDLNGVKFYTRGDGPVYYKNQSTAGLVFSQDKIMHQNSDYFEKLLLEILIKAGMISFNKTLNKKEVEPDKSRKLAEEHFHDKWAQSVDVSAIDVRKMNEACTAPEMRYIRKILGDLKDRTLLDVGCGLGEASVYFALNGAEVTATDISAGMCDVAQRLAVANGVKIKTHVSAAEELGLGADAKFDIIYTGNTLHHVDILSSLPLLLKHLKPDGIFVSWDPVAYNPAINYYRRNAMAVRTEDEHPLRLVDIKNIGNHFSNYKTKWFWLSTLLIFVIMAIIQRRNPNKERFWKKVVEEADDWSLLYKPLEVLDKWILLIPFLRPLCWNVVIVGIRPKI